MLALHTYQPLWNDSSFDFDASIFPPHMLQPFRHQLPGQLPAPIAPAAGSFADVMKQQQQAQQNEQNQHLPQQGMGLPPIANFGMTAPPPQQTRPSQQQMGSVTPKRQTNVMMTERSPIGEDIVRGHTPEGETREQKALRYRDQLKAAAAQKMADSMAKQGYNVQQLSAGSAPKLGGLWNSMTFLHVRY